MGKNIAEADEYLKEIERALSRLPRNRADRETHMDRLTIKLGNVHCDDCSRTIDKVVSEVLDVEGHSGIKYRLTDSFIVVVGPKGVLAPQESRLLRELQDTGFEIVSSDLETDQVTRNDKSWFASRPQLPGIHLRSAKHRQHRAHLKHCKECADKENANQGDTSSIRRSFNKVFASAASSSSDQTAVDFSTEKPGIVIDNETIYRAVIAVGGMTCVSCAETVNAAIHDTLKEHNVPVDDDTSAVSAVANTAVVILPNKQLINTIIQAIRDVGYTASLLELLPIERSTKYKVTAAIGGMTCAACSSAIENAVSELPFVLEYSVSVVAKNGAFIIDSNTQENVATLKETVEDAGYDFELLDVAEVNHATKKTSSRSINLKVDGMFCEHCPEEINDYLSKFGESIVIVDPITLDRPFVKFTYVPAPPALSIRKILKDLNEISSNFKIEIIKPVTLEEHLRKMARHDTMKIAKRLAITTLVAIPTFIIGVVFMTLLPKSHHLRQWSMESVWVGNVSRAVWALFILATVVYIFADDIFHRKAIVEVRNLWKSNVSWKRRLFKFGSMSLLMSLGTSVAYFSSIALLALSAKAPKEGNGYSTTYFDSVVFLTFFLLIGRLLEAFSKSKTTEAVTRLSSIKPHTAHFVEKVSEEGAPLAFDNDEVLSTDLLETGDYIKVVPGESPAADAIIIQGVSQFDESALTGESLAVSREIGEQVFAGTVNVGSSSVICKIAALDGSSLIDQIVSAVQDGQLKKAPIERTADALTGIFVPIICALAVLTWVIWISLGYSGSLPQSYLDIDVGGWCVWSLEFAIAVFVVACPCGIGLAAPTALFVGSGLAASYGILAKGGGAAFQDGAKVEVACFDKTGTLTLGGDPTVNDYAILNEKEGFKVEYFALQTARDLELSSKHPLSLAVKKFISNHCSKTLTSLSANIVPEVQEIPGKGLKGDIVVEGGPAASFPESALIGNEALFTQFEAQEFTTRQRNVLNSWKEQGKSVICVALRWEAAFKTPKYVPVMIMSARDQIRPEARNVIAALQKQGISCWMVSGDNATTAKSIATQLGIENVVAEVLPEEKAAKVKWIQETFHATGKEGTTKPAVVAMIGDGINDAPALAAADVGIAMGSGSDLALTSSDFVLLSPSYPLVTLLNLLSLSRSVFNRVRFNFCWALVYNMIGIPIAAGVIYPYQNSRLSPVWASAAMAASSISVVLSSLALKLFKPPQVQMDDTQLDFQEPIRTQC